MTTPYDASQSPYMSPGWSFNGNFGASTNGSRDVNGGQSTDSIPTGDTGSRGTDTGTGTTTPTWSTAPHSTQVLANNAVSSNPWDSVSHNQFTQHQDWQDFKFDNPTEDWQRNFNQLDGMDKWRYGMGNQTGNPAVMKMALIAKGIDPTQASHIVDAFGTSANNYRAGLGMGDSPWYTSGAGMLNGGVRSGLGMIQEGSQLWGMDGRGNRYLVKDFTANGGNGGWQNLANMTNTGNLYNNASYQGILNSYGQTAHGGTSAATPWAASALGTQQQQPQTTAPAPSAVNTMQNVAPQNLAPEPAAQVYNSPAQVARRYAQGTWKTQPVNRGNRNRIYNP